MDRFCTKQNIKGKNHPPKRKYEMNLLSLGSIAPIVSGFTGIGGSYMCWLRNDWKRGDDKVDLLGSNKEIHTESEFTSVDFDCEPSNA